MSTQSDAMPDSKVNSSAAPAVISATQPLLWSVKRELWENRSIYMAPLILAALILFAFLISTFAGIWEKALAIDPSLQPQKLSEPYTLAAFMIMAASFVVGVFYCLDCLYGERRDRSILFWKSMPVSDLTTVLSKASIPLLVLPVVTFAITIAVHWFMLLISIAVLLIKGQSVATLWNNLGLFRMWIMLFYHLFAIHSLWYAPLYAWLIFASAWAKRMPILWAGLPLLAIGILEKISFNTTHFASLMGYRFAGGPEATTMSSDSVLSPMTHLTPGKFIVSPGLWVGLLFAAVLLAGAVRLRRLRGPI